MHCLLTRPRQPRPTAGEMRSALPSPGHLLSRDTCTRLSGTPGTAAGTDTTNLNITVWSGGPEATHHSGAAGKAGHTGPPEENTGARQPLGRCPGLCTSGGPSNHRGAFKEPQQVPETAAGVESHAHCFLRSTLTHLSTERGPWRLLLRVPEPPALGPLLSKMRGSEHKP